MAFYRATLGGGGSDVAYGHINNLTANQSVTVSGLGFEPTVIMAVTTDNGDGGAYTFLFDKDFSLSQQRYCGQNQKTWGTYAYPATSASGFSAINSDGFIFHQNPSYGAAGLDYIAIKE